jgi:hypothetical protein
MRSILLLALLVPMASIVACGSDDDVANDDTNEINAKKAKEGELCGGFAGTKCAEGLRCTLGSEGLNTGRCAKDSNATPKKDAGATPAPPGDDDDDDTGTGAGAGETCGGFAGTKCKPPLRCDNSLGLNTGRCR